MNVKDRNGNVIAKGDKVIWYDPQTEYRDLSRVWVIEEINEEMAFISDDFGECECLPTEIAKVDAEMINEYQPVYDSIQDVSNDIRNFCGFAKMNGKTTDEVTIKLIDRLTLLASEISNVAKELGDHMVWDK